MKTIATQSRPSSASREEPSGSAKWKTARIESTKSSMAGSVSRARSSSRRSLRASTAASPKYLRKSKPSALKSRQPLRVVRRHEQRSPLPQLRQLAIEERRAVLVQAGERLVEDQQVRPVQQRPAERQPLQLPTRQRRSPLTARLPEPEPLEQHPDPLAPFRSRFSSAVSSR